MSELYTKEEFESAYNFIFTKITGGKKPEPTEKVCVYILGGQPGAGKSYFYQNNTKIKNFVVINGDEYREYHPRHKEIMSADPENYATRTQEFTNEVVNKLIDELGARHYNLIIEGTLRTTKVPLDTQTLLSNIGYRTTLVVITCDAQQAWESTIERARQLLEKDMFPRLVPIDVYDYIVKHLAENVQAIKDANSFDEIMVLHRDGNPLYSSKKNEVFSVEPRYIVERVLNVSAWEKKFQYYKREFINCKIDILQRLKEREESDDDLEC